MKILKESVIVICTLTVVFSAQIAVVHADIVDSVYDDVMEALETLPRDGGIAVDFGVEDGRYAENFRLTEVTLRLLRDVQAPKVVIDGLKAIISRDFASKEACMQAVEQAIGQEHARLYEELILNSAYDGRATFKFGDTFEARFRADTDCYVALIHIGAGSDDKASGNKTAGGNILVLLPNQHMADTRIQGGQVYSTIHDFSINLIANPPQGEEVINILCSTEPFDLFADTGRFSQGYAVITPDDNPALQYFLNGLQQAAAGKFGGTSLILQVGGGIRAALPKKFGRLKPMGGTGTTGKFFPPLETP